MRRTNFVLVGVAVFASAFLQLRTAEPGTGETVEELQKVATEGLPDIQDLRDGMADAAAVLKGFEAEPALRTTVSRAIAQQEIATVQSELQRRATNTTVAIRKVEASRSVLIASLKTRKGRTVVVCLAGAQMCGKNGDRLAAVTVE